MTDKGPPAAAFAVAAAPRRVSLGGMSFRPTLSLLVSLLALPLAARAAISTERDVKILEDRDRIRFNIGGDLFTDYWFLGASKPYFYPVNSIAHLNFTRDWPMRDTRPGEERDHPHHRGLWFAHGNVNGIDFWSEGPKCGKIIHDSFDTPTSGRIGEIREHLHWEDAAGATVLTEERLIRVQGLDDGQLLDIETTLKASEGPLVFGDTKEGAMAIRLAESMRLTHRDPADKKKTIPGAGHILTSEGAKDEAAWGTRAKWVDYTGPLGNEIVGVAIYDHPANPRYPTWFHSRDYGLHAANPFGQHDFEKLADAHAGDLKVPEGESVTFRWRFFLHNGDTARARVAERYQEYIIGRR